MATSPARLLAALLAVTSVALADDPILPRVVTTNPKKTAAAVSREYPPLIRPGNPLGDLTLVTVVRLDKPKEKPLLLKGHKQAITALDWSADGKQLVSGGLDGAVIVWDAATGKAVTTIDHGRAVGAVAFAKDGKVVVSAPFVPDPVAAAAAKPEDDAKTPGGTAVVWDAATGKEVKKLDDAQGPLTAAVRVPKADLIATAGANNTLCLWSVSDAKLAHTFKLDAPLAQVLATADGKRVFGLTSGAREVKVFDPDGKKELTAFKGMKHDLAAVGISTDGKYLLAVGDLPSKQNADLTIQRTVFALLTLGFSEALNGDVHLKNRPCYVWSVAGGKVVAKCLWQELDPSLYGFGETGLGK